jgi:hypothetical protein
MKKLLSHVGVIAFGVATLFTISTVPASAAITDHNSAHGQSAVLSGHTADSQTPGSGDALVVVVGDNDESAPTSYIWEW